MTPSRLFHGIALILIALPSLLSAQSGFKPLTDLQIFGSSTFDFRQSQLNIKDVKGTPYLSEEYMEGNVLMSSTMYEGILLRYDVYNDRFEARLEQNTIIIDPVKNVIDTFYYSGYKFVRIFIDPDRSNALAHVAVLYKSNHCNLYKKYKVTLIPATKPGAYTEANPAKFDPVLPDYYLGSGEEMILLKGVKSIAGFFDVEPKEVKSMMKSSQLKLQSEEDLVRICTHFSN